MSELVWKKYMIEILSVNKLTLIKNYMGMKINDILLTLIKFLFIEFFVILMSSVKRFPIFIFSYFNRLTDVNKLKYFNELTGIDYQTFDDYPDA